VLTLNQNRTRRRGDHADSQWEDFNRKVIDDFKSNAGKVSGRYARAPMILVTQSAAVGVGYWCWPHAPATAMGLLMVIAPH
jgi:hypothetical protein